MTPAQGASGPVVPAAKKKKKPVLGIVFLVLFVGGLVALAVFYRNLFGSKVGGSCSVESDCVRGAMCIGKKCYRSCETDADCKDGWQCGGTTVSETPGGNAANGFKLKSVNICFSPESMAPVKEKQRAEALEAKKRDVDLRVIVLLTTTPPQLTPAQFDAAWAAIPAADKESKSVDELARAVLAATHRSN